MTFILFFACIIYLKRFHKTVKKSGTFIFLNHALKRPEASDSYIFWCVRAFFFTLLYSLLMPTIAIVVFIFTIALIAVACTIPLIGMAAGVEYIHKYVIEPTACHSIPNRERLILGKQKNKSKEKTAKPTNMENFATCISLTNGKDVVAGRLVYMTTTAATLFDPESGKVQTIPTKDKTISIIDKL